MPKLDLDTIPQTNATGYPKPFSDAVQGRWYRRLAPASGLTEMGVSHVTLKPGAWSSQRHWHEDEDEFVVMLAGEAVLIEDEGETLLRPGDCVVFPKGRPNGHHLQNRSDTDCVFIAVSAGPRGSGDYPDIDMRFTPDGYFHKDGTPYETERLP
ncbi:cupin domain-containing protein [Sphingomonas psychrotolerans]|uniref:Cupin domain-containing protein n=1 Tax=Sphingomonas psychrotolerans TaxID=1327635 RepID=A0ABU3N5U9_9SPHN|nr:cupin domain-containing protein [Sphingomonas psychrotolerans]MDT8759773.1 cupin domain-containing protein [Sphingomonas psychrotolerans]